MHGERFVNDEPETVNGKHMASERKNGKGERFWDCMYTCASWEENFKKDFCRYIILSKTFPILYHL